MSQFRRAVVDSVTAPGWWRIGDPVGQRQFLTVSDFTTEAGVYLGAIDVAYETWGTLNESRDNAILVLHALTGDSHVLGEAGQGHKTPGWWNGLMGPGMPIDTDRWFVVAPNVLGGCQGTTGPSSKHPEDGQAWGSRFPQLTIRDQVRLEHAFSQELGLTAFAGVIGGSMGGMRALEWGVSYPHAVQNLMLLATTAIASADQIAWCAPQIAAICQDPDFFGGDYYGQGSGLGPIGGMGVARQIAHTTYRSAEELNSRFGRDAQIGEDTLRGGRYAVESYLEYHSIKLAQRFDPNSYLVLTGAMNSHDVGRDRGGIESALALVTARTLVIGIDTDRMFPVGQNVEIASGVKNSSFHVVHSEHGHDGFLVEIDAVGEHIGRFLADAEWGGH